jgi:hypothetical protein
LVETFNQNNPDIVIQYNPTPDDYVTKLNTIIAGGTPPDIAYIPDGNFSAFAPRGALVNLQPYIETSTVIDVENIWPTALGRYRYAVDHGVDRRFSDLCRASDHDQWRPSQRIAHHGNVDLAQRLP